MRVLNNMKLRDDLFDSRLSLDGQWGMSGPLLSGRRRDCFPEGKAASV